MLNVAFYTGIIILLIYILIIAWSIAVPSKRIWPPPGKYTWQFFIFWGLFFVPVFIEIFLIIKDFNTWTIPVEIRICTGIPLMILGGSLTVWGISVLGLESTSGIDKGLVVKPPYTFTRNPQYTGDIFLIAGLILFANSVYVSVLLSLTILTFIMLPLAEEKWLEEKFGDEYLKYKTGTPRFL